MNQILSTIKKTVLLTGFAATLHACKIDVEPTDRYTDVAIWRSTQTIDMYVIGLYNEFKTFKFGTFPIGYDNHTDALTDIMKFTSTVSGNGTVNILATDASRVNAAGPQLNYWAAGYNRIRTANEFLDGIDKYANLDEETKNRYKAEARFMRGYAYFWLARLHGSVVLLESLDQYAEKSHIRASEDEVWNFIAADFAFAAEHLPKSRTGSTTGRLTKGAAYGMLARTWLYAASIAEYDRKQFNQDPLTGVPQAKATGYYQNATSAAEKVIELANEGYYALDPNFANIFTNKDTKEAIIKLDFVSPQLTHNFDLGYAPAGDIPGQGLVYGVPTAELVDKFEMKDGRKFSWQDPAMAANPYTDREPRFYATILYNGASWKGRTIDTKPDNANEGFVQYASTAEPKKTVTGYYVRKMLDPNNTNFVVNKSTQTWIEMRYAEILLIHAEAKTKAGDLAGGRASLNKLRNERGLPNATAQTAAEMMAAIEHERIVELAFEGHRYWDLRRWRKAHIVLNNVRFTGHKVTQNGPGLKYEVVSADNTNRQFTPALYYIPIPEAEVQRNTGLNQIQGW